MVSALFLTGMVTACGEDAKDDPIVPPVIMEDAGDTGIEDADPEPEVNLDVPDPEPDAQPDAQPDTMEPDAPLEPDQDVLEPEMPPMDVGEDIGEDVPPDMGECSANNPCRDGVCNLDLGQCEDKTPCFGPLDCVDGEFGDRICAGCEDGNCVDGGTCRDRCDNIGQCPGDDICIDGGCGQYPELDCTGNGDCPGAQICDSQAYTCIDAPVCGDDGDCAEGRLCDEGVGVCVTCLVDRDCDGLQTCVRGDFASFCDEPDACLSDDDCLDLRLCDQQTSLCINPQCADDRFEPNNRVNENVVFLDPGVYTGLRVCGAEADLFLIRQPVAGPC